MASSRVTATSCATLLFALLCTPLAAQIAAPTIHLTSAAGAVFETEQAAIALEGNAIARDGLSSVHWVNQFGARGNGAWSGSAPETGWTISAIPLRAGVNLLAVTVVDTQNRSATLHLAVNRKSLPGTAPEPLKIGAGSWQNRPIVYQLWNGYRVVEGDIILDADDATRPAPARQTDAAGGISPDGISINYTSQLWPLVSGVHQVPYTQTGSNANLTTAINAFNGYFPGLIQFVPRSGQANYVQITVAAGGSGEGFSQVGVAGNGAQQLNCGGGCTVATWLHEMGHTVGLLHEHQRPDRDTFISLNLANADLPNVPGNFTLFSFDYQKLGLYDYASIMHYGAFNFSKAGLPVIESIPAGIPLSNNNGYSAGDIDQVKRLYGATPSLVTVTTNPAGMQVIVDGTSYTAPQTFNFALHSTHTLNLPPDPQNTNPADGSAYGFGAWNDRKARSHTITVAPGGGALAAPATSPAVTLYEANFVRFQPFAFMSPGAYPNGSGTVHVAPAPKAKFGGSYFTDRQLVKVSVTKNAGFGFFDWFNLPYPPSANPLSFYIQAPTTAAQAVLVPISGTGAVPVTIIGATLTGTNTWNPGIAGSVDGNFTLLPTGFTPFYNGAAWNGQTHHTISVQPTQSPVTTNVYYNFNSWSDGLEISHSITQPKTGAKTVTTSLTPFYASYTVPPPLGSANADCAGGVATSPPGIVYPINSFLFYSDGSSVTATATPNPSFPAMLFAGWTGSLTGSGNPQTITINDQFVPTANFNLTTAPITIATFTPASVVARPTALNLTVNGTGFTTNPANTFAYWNGNFRTSTLVSSTQLIMHLNAGDLTTPGGQDVFVGNYTTNASSQTCGVGAEASFTVNVKPAP